MSLSLLSLVDFLKIRSPNVEFAGYNVPHPLENKMKLRIQTKPGKIKLLRLLSLFFFEILLCLGAQQTAVECLKQALRDTKDACEIVKTTFMAENEKFRK